MKTTKIIVSSDVKKSFEPTEKHDRLSNGLYGDMISLLLTFVMIVVHGWNLYQMEPDHPRRSIARSVYVSMVVPIFPNAAAVFFGNLWCSRLKMASKLYFQYYSTISEWPFEGECTITTSLQGGILMAVLANISLSFNEKMIRLAALFIVGTCTSVKSPYSVYVEDTLPILGGSILLAIFVLYVYHFKISKHLATVQGARLILLAIFTYNASVNLLSYKLSSRSGYEIISSMTKLVILICIGIISTGSFQNEVIEKERLEILVRKRTQKLHMVNMALQASETAITITDKWGSIVWLNAAFERLLGEKEERLLGLLLKDVIFKLDMSRKENKYLLMESCEDLSKTNEEELQINESTFRLEVTPFPSESYSNNKPTTNDRFLMVFKNITAGRAREVAEKKAHHEAIMAKAMGESMVTLTHELRTPLQGIMGVTSLLQQQASDWGKDALESLKLIMASSTLLLNLINNLLDVRKTTSKMMEEFPLSSISASDPIKDAVGFCQPLASISNVKIVIDLGCAKNSIVKSNALRLQQVLINLISNAIKYTKRGSAIRIQIRTVTLGDVRTMVSGAIASSRNDSYEKYDNESPMLVFSVSDCGPGIAPDQAGRLFRRYSQLDTKPERTLGSSVGQPIGTGLGLHLCQLFVERMNGEIWVINNGREAGGSSFSFYLPLDSRISKRRAAICHSNSRNHQCRSIKKKGVGSVFDCRVLMVDDMFINRKVFDRMLKKIGIKNLVTVESGKKALEELSRNHYDLVITDIQMPTMSGTELSVAIQNSANKSSPPIVVGLTAATGADIIEQCSDSGMSYILYKPITLSEMRDFFESKVPNLESGIWFDSDHDLGMKVISMQVSKKSAAKKNERLLLEVFPEKIAGALREGQRIEPEHHEIVTIYFSDIVGFTNISSILTPIKVSSMLDRLYLKFDELSRKYDVFKIETIGDAYMAVTNLVKEQEDHVKRIANFARDTIDAALTTLIDEDRPELGYVKIRVGFHSGPVVSNVVGSRNPKFTIIGDTVNAAARMESNSLPLQIQCSEQSASILKEKHPDISCVLRGEIQVKGKGKMITYWVHQR